MLFRSHRRRHIRNNLTPPKHYLPSKLDKLLRQSLGDRHLEKVRRFEKGVFDEHELGQVLQLIAGKGTLKCRERVRNVREILKKGWSAYIQTECEGASH